MAVPNEPQTRYGALVRAGREHLGLNQRDCARRIGILQSTLSLIEQGKATPKPETAARIAKTLGLDPVEALLAWLVIELPSGYRIVQEEVDG